MLNVNIVKGWLIAEGMKPRKSNYKEDGPGGPGGPPNLAVSKMSQIETYTDLKKVFSIKESPRW